MNGKLKLPPLVPALKSPPAQPSRRCPATTRIVEFLEVHGVQCKYERGHDGDHAGSRFGRGDVFWPQVTS